MKKILFIITLISSSAELFPQWNILNGPFETQSVGLFLSHPNGTLFATGEDYPSGGNPTIYRSIDNGETWIKVSSNITIQAYRISCLVVDTVNRIYAGCGSEFFYSNDNGDNWTEVNLPSSGAIYSMVFDSLGNIFLGTTSGIYRTNILGNIWFELFNLNTIDLVMDENESIYAATSGGIYFSSDQGVTWIARNNGLPDVICRNINRNSSGELFTNVFYNGIYKSTDNGLNWVITDTTSPSRIWDFFIDQNDILYGCKWVSSGVGLKGIYKSTNNGISWEYLGLGNKELTYCISADQQNNLYVGTNTGLYQYSELDSTWFLGNIYRGYGNILAFAFCSDNSILASSSMRLWKSEDSGLSWDYIIDSPISLIYEGYNDRMFISNRYGPLPYSDDCGINFGTASINGISKIYKTSDDKLVAGTDYYLFNSNDNGTSWLLFASTFPVALGLDIFNDIEINDSGDIFASQSGELAPNNHSYSTVRSTDGGTTFEGIYYTREVSSIEIDIHNNLYLGTLERGVVKSTNNGNTWAEINSGLNNWYINDLTISPDGVLLAGTNNGVHRYIDSINVWVLVDNTGLISSRIHNMQFKDDVLYVGTDAGIAFYTGPLPVELISFTAFYSSPNVQLTWSTATELNNHGFEIEISIDKAIWATIGFREGKGTTSEPQDYTYSDNISEISSSKLFYRLKQIDFNGSFEYSDVVEVEIAPTKFSLDQNYANPFNPSTKISWQSPVSGWQTLKVYDVLGNEVATLVNEERPAGKYEVEFNASSLSSGVYYYQLRAGEFSESKKMILIK